MPRTIEDKDALIFSANEVCEFGEHVEIPEMPLSHKPSTYWIIVTSDPRQIHIGRIVLPNGVSRVVKPKKIEYRSSPLDI